ncbi:surface antigen BspA-like [Trichomonas vaginalis G3]|uniref:Surface antigen BspA-like n=1 Tax=Trichomonas vaginalis (strain ATCC PRA-98 / G3) TaxID=412133 RepID=A2EEA7_TRIV3|nr:ribonuclease inhibitor domain-containing protein [Trichomonas vaginalis G3]EAY09005.1 surface antigen BspA-like [Trichomonas vaginalis G3]KAI5496286.1 ribonuclease inhibitor domain-containing protein [Trichomonas vaginalis G3]|eukprot:XP_001321228.1 surface antigen BspA-like [Trichomonas vaginalis G3]
MQSIQSISIPPLVIEFPTQLFFQCTKLQSINIPMNSQLRLYGWHSLSNTLINTLFIPQKLKILAQGCIENTILETFTIHPENIDFRIENRIVISKDNVTILYPTKLTGNVNIPFGVIGIGGSSFSICKFTSINIPNTVRTIGSYAFIGTSLIEVVIPDSVTFIDKNAFCTPYLKKVTLSKNLTVLTELCFKNTQITEIQIPPSVKQINDMCFLGCKITVVYLPDSVKMLNGKFFNDNVEIKFGNNSNLYVNQDFLILNKQNTTVIQHIGPNSNITISIPSTVTTIGKNAFRDKTKLIEISFQPDSQLEIINGSAFYNCISMVFTRLPQTVKTIEISAFYQCYKLQSISFPILTSIGKYAFQNCIGLTSADIQLSSVVTLDHYAFMGCKLLPSFNLPRNIEYLGISVFQDCIKLNKVQFRSTLISIKESCFQNCALDNVDLSQCTNLYDISNRCFYNNTNLHSIAFPPSIRSFGISSLSMTAITSFNATSTVCTISTKTFDGCPLLTEFIIDQDSVLTPSGLGVDVFRNCPKLRNIICLSQYFHVITSALFTPDDAILIIFPPASRVSSFGLPGTVKTIGEGAFSFCTNLQSVFIPSDSLTSVSARAFEGCTSLTWINIPICVQNIGINAFKDCSNLLCGVKLENITKAYINQIVTNSGLTKQALNSCRVQSCVRDLPKTSLSYSTFVVIIVM